MSFMNWHDSINRLDLNDKFVVNDDVHSIATVETNRLIGDWQRYLTSKIYASLLQLITEAILISRFQKTRPELAMHVDCHSNHAITE